ncbi:MAG TPA: alpha-amylase family protein [Actinomycetes bacterium]|nr:alpha-amylase family protein [Actinomycetes bacterium]
MRTEATSDLWWKNAVVYCVDVKTFQDSGGDGIGDLDGLGDRLDYLAGLGVTCLWLLPIMPSPWRDNGYDVTDYFDVDRRLGTLADVVELLRAARERGIRVLTDLVVNHTSDEHPWFRAARSSRDNPYRDYYVWRDRPEPQPAGLVFPGEEDSNWQLDPATGQYYLHRFYRFQPDLNIEDPRVRAEFQKIMGLWLELGFSGFRVDAAPFLIETEGITGKSPKDPHAPLRDMRGFLSRRRGEAALLGEANVAADQLTGYFGQHGNELHMLFNFILNQALYLSLVREDPRPLAEHLRELPVTPLNCQYANFVRNADELSLDKLSEAERQEVFDAFAPDENMRLYGRGIRRRLPPMVGGDQRRLELAYSLLFSLPDTPVLLYGEEIGMGDDLDAPGRASVRTAMQWSDEPNAGFSTAERIWPPIVADGPFGYRRVNVRDQLRDPDSLLRRVTALIRARKQCPELGFGHWRLLETDQDRVLAHAAEWAGGRVVALHNLAGTGCRVKVDLPAGAVEQLVADRREQKLPATGTPIPLEPYGWRWLRLHGG